MSRASHLLWLLTSLTDNEINGLAPGDRHLLQGQLERVSRMVTGVPAMSDAGKATAPAGREPQRGKAAFLDDLRDGRGRE